MITYAVLLYKKQRATQPLPKLELPVPNPYPFASLGIILGTFLSLLPRGSSKTLKSMLNYQFSNNDKVAITNYSTISGYNQSPVITLYSV